MHPRQFPGLRDRMVAHYRSYGGPTSSALNAAELYWVSETQAQRSFSMARKLDDYVGMLQYAPSPAGFMWLDGSGETYAISYDSEGVRQRVPIRAVSWERRPTESDQTPLYLTAWCETSVLASARNQTWRAELTPLFYGEFNVQAPETFRVRFIFGNQATDIPQNMFSVIFVIWYRMTEERYHTREHSEPSSVRAKKLANRGESASRETVTVVDIRKSSKGARGERGTGAGTGKPLAFRDEVQGHFRTYYTGPGRAVPQKKWVDDFERGPEDAPKRPKKITVKTFK